MRIPDFKKRWSITPTTPTQHLPSIAKKLKPTVKNTTPKIIPNPKPQTRITIKTHKGNTIRIVPYDQKKYERKYGRVLGKAKTIGQKALNTMSGTRATFSMLDISQAYQEIFNQKLTKTPDIFTSNEPITVHNILEEGEQLIIYPHERAAIICFKKGNNEMILQVSKINLLTLMKDKIQGQGVRKLWTITPLIRAFNDALNTLLDYKLAIRKLKSKR